MRTDMETDSLYYRDVQNLWFLYLKVMFCPRLPLLNSDDADRKWEEVGHVLTTRKQSYPAKEVNTQKISLI